MVVAAARNTQGAACLIASPKGASSTANSTANGTATRAAITAPEIILRRAICGTPRLRRKFASRISGVAMVSPGMPSNAVGTAWVMCLATAPARKKVNTPAAGTPSSTTSKVRGARVVVSSLPEIRPMAANTTAPITPISTAIRTWSNRASIRRHLASGRRCLCRRRLRWRARLHRTGAPGPVHATRCVPLAAGR
ncbi:hypothetical protein D3C80_997080 [compost metagenome]